MYGYIYKTTNILNGKIYIGQKKSDKFLHEEYLGSGKILLQSIRKNGKDKFTVELLEECNSAEELNDREKYWIKEHNSTNPDIGYNMSSGGYVPVLYGEHNGFFGKHHSEETREKFKQRKKLAGVEHPMYGKHHSEAAKKLIGDKNRGRPKTEEEKQKRIDTLNKHGGTTWWITEEYKQKLSNSLKGKDSKAKGRIWIQKGSSSKMIYKEELDTFLSLGWKLGRPFLNEITRRRRSESMKGRPAYNKGRIRVSKDGVRTFIPKKDTEKYINDGWKIGW